MTALKDIRSRWLVGAAAGALGIAGVALALPAHRATGPLPVSVSQTSTGYTTSSGDPMANWRNPSAIEFVYRGGLGLWTEPRCPVASIGSTTITMGQPCWNNSTKRVMRTDGSGRTVNLVGRQSITEAPTAVGD